MNNNILIFGKGYIAQRLQQTLDCAATDTRITCFSDVEAILNKHKPEIIINCIGHTGERNVDDCEKAVDKTLLANTYIPILLAEAAYRHQLKFVQIGSGCVYHYDYDKPQPPIKETDMPDFYDLFYSRTRMYAEDVLTQLDPKKYDILNLRIRVPLDNKPYPKNILTKLIEYKTVIDAPNSATYIPDLIKALEHLLKIDARGTYNVVCKGGLQYSTLLDEYKRFIPDFDYKIIRLKDLKLVRTNLVLSTTKLENTGFEVRTANEVAKECIKEYVKFV